MLTSWYFLAKMTMMKRQENYVYHNLDSDACMPLVMKTNIKKYV